MNADTYRKETNPFNRKALAEKFGSRKCYFAMTQACLANPIAPAHALDGMKTLNPSSFGVRGVVCKKVVGKKPNWVSANCAITIPGTGSVYMAMATPWA
jgi:hypothetical protein